MCTRCGSREPGRRFAVDGTAGVVCGQCVRDDIRIAAAHETIRRIHKSVHGYEEDCPTCEADLWLQHQRTLEQLETSIARANDWRDAELP